MTVRMSRHLHYMMKNSVDVDSEHECLPYFFTGCLNCIRHHTAPGSLLRLTSVLVNDYRHYLHHVLKPYILYSL